MSGRRTFSPNIKDSDVLEDFRYILQIEQLRLKSISHHGQIADILSFF